MDEALAAGLIHETVTSFPARGGRPRSGRGLAVGPAPDRPEQRVKPATLRRRRLTSGLSQRQLAGRLGVSVMLVNHWEKGRQPVSSRYGVALEEALRAPAPTAALADAKAAVVLEALSGGPLPLNRLVAQVGGERTTRAALGRLLAEGKVHRGTTFVPSKGGSRRPCPAFALGPPPKIDPFGPGELRQLRRRAGLTQEQLANAIGTSTAVVGRWERETVPAFATPQLRELLERLPEVDPVAEAEAEVLAAVVEHPAGISAKDLRRRLGRQDAVIGEAIERALKRGLIHEDRTGRKSGRRRLHATPPPAPLSGAELAERRCALGWSQGELGALAGISGSLISGYENGRPVPTATRRRLLEALGDGESGALPRGRPIRRRGRPYSSAAAEAWLESIREPRPWHEITGQLSARSIDSPGRELLEAWVRQGRLHVYEELRPGKRGLVRRRMVAPGPGRPNLALTGAELARLRQAAGLSRPELARAVGLHPVGGRIGAWENDGGLIPQAWAEQLLSALDRHRKAAPRADNRRTSWDELRRLAFDVIAGAPGALSATQVAQRLPGDVRRRWAVLAELEAEGAVHTRPLVYPDSTGRQQTKQVYDLGAPPSSKVSRRTGKRS